MCDYSLHAHENRLAVEGETLVTCRFPGGSIGLANPSNVDEVNNAPWNAHKVPPLVAVCVPPGASLTLCNIPVRLQQEFRVSVTEPVKFIQLGYEAYTHRDGVRFVNGREVLLQRLNEGQYVQVLSVQRSNQQAQAQSQSATSQKDVSISVIRTLVNYVSSFFGGTKWPAPVQSVQQPVLTATTSSRRTGRVTVASGD